MYRDESYFKNPDFDSSDSGGYHGYKDYLRDHERIERKFAGVLAHVERLRRPGTLLDVGAGPGFLVAEANRRGWEARGLDLNPWTTEFARESLGVEVSCVALEEAGLDAECLDAVTAMDLIEHLPDPADFLDEVARVLRPGGAFALLTPDAGSAVSRALGSRWPEVQRAPEHLILYSVEGLAALIEKHGFRAIGWHSIGKESELRTLIADVSPAAPATGRLAARIVDHAGVADRPIDLDPRTKFCLYAVRSDESTSPRSGYIPRFPKSAPAPVANDAVFDDLNALASAPRLINWMFRQYAHLVRGDVAEIGAGIGTFSELILRAGAETAVLVEPDEACAGALESRLAADDRVRVAREFLPDAPSLAVPKAFDFIVCQNVLEHVREDAAAVTAMARALKPGGNLTLLVPAHPRLYGSLDEAYGHYRRYTRDGMRRLVADANLHLQDLYSFNLLGVPGWWLKNRLRSSALGTSSIRAYETLLGAWAPIEGRVRPRFGLSLIVHATRPPD